MNEIQQNMKALFFLRSTFFDFSFKCVFFPSKVSLPFNLLFASTSWSQNSGALVMVDWPVR